MSHGGHHLCASIEPPYSPLRRTQANSAARLVGTDRDRLSGRPRSRVNFDETVEFVANLAVNPRKADQVWGG